MIKIDVEIGDIIYGGRFKNKKTVVKTIGTDENGQPTINGKTILKFKIKKPVKESLLKTLDNYIYKCIKEYSEK